MFVSSELAEDSIKSESVNKTMTTYDPENGKETAEFYREYFGSQMEIQPYEFEQEQEMNYMYPDIFTVTADAASDMVKQITFFEVDEEDIRTILKIVDFPEEPMIEEALSFKGDLKEPNFGDMYSTEYNDDLGLGADITIKGSLWSEENKKPYSLTLFYDKKTYDKNAE